MPWRIGNFLRPSIFCVILAGQVLLTPNSLIKFLCACARSFFGSSWLCMCFVATDALAEGDRSAGRLRPLGV